MCRNVPLLSFYKIMLCWKIQHTVGIIKAVKLTYKLQMTYPVDQFQPNLIKMLLWGPISNVFKDINSLENFGWCLSER